LSILFAPSCYKFHCIVHFVCPFGILWIVHFVFPFDILWIVNFVCTFVLPVSLDCPFCLPLRYSLTFIIILCSCYFFRTFIYNHLWFKHRRKFSTSQFSMFI
jgi:hypothetical protein